MTGVKLRGQTAEKAVSILVQTVSESWNAWALLVGAEAGGLSWHIDGRF